MGKYQCWTISGFYSWFFIFFFIYINDLIECLTTSAKLLADDISLFSVVHDTQRSANYLNEELEIINNWVF